MVFLDNGQIRLGVKKSSGAGVAWFSLSGTNRNLVNHWDRGRLIQQSYYGEPDGSLWNKQPWSWNPVQGGDWQGIPATVLELRNTTNTLYARSWARHWASGEELTNVVFEESITLTGLVAHIHFKMTYSGTNAHPERDHEIPAIFVAPNLDRLVLYDGKRPWTGDAVNESKPGWPNEPRTMTENWAAYVGTNGSGIGAYVPIASRLTCYRFGDGREDHGSCSYFAPLIKFAITPGKVFGYDLYLTAGTVPEMRERFGQIRAQAVEVATNQPVALRFATNSTHELTLKEISNGLYSIETTGGDPFLFTETIPNGTDLSRNHILTFDYFSAAGTDPVQVFLVPPTSEALSVTGFGLGVSQGWSTYSLDLQPALEKARDNVTSLRIDFGTKPKRSAQIRGLRLRSETEREIAMRTRRDDARRRERALDTKLRSYLVREFPCEVTVVNAGQREIQIEGRVSGNTTNYVLVEIPMHAEATELRQFPTVQSLLINPNGSFSAKISRHELSAGGSRDHLLSRWAVARKAGDGFELMSRAHYADMVQAIQELPEEKPRNRKGLGALWSGRPLSDLDDLDIGSVTVNINLNSLVRTTPGDGLTPFDYAGRTWYANNSYVVTLDNTMLEASKRKIIVSAIILISQASGAGAGDFARMIAHPDADPSGIYVMPNMTSEDGIKAYGAAVDFLAQRYSRPDRQFGRIHHWIVHNEVDMGWIWTNAGEKTALRYMDLYHKSMRLAHLIARQYDPHAKAFISLTHHWHIQTAPNFFDSRTMLERLLEFCRAEGDFEWAIAYHPYPQDLFRSRSWEDTDATFTFNTRKITYKNLEILDAWVRRPEMMFKGRQVRTVHLSEQGVNSKDYSEKSLNDQAAGMAYAWKKLEPLKSIEVFHYHNWVDNRGEGGLRIGLRKFPDEPGDPLGKKPVWEIFRAVGTTNEAATIDFAKEMIGIKSWSEVHYGGPIR